MELKANFYLQLNEFLTNIKEQLQQTLTVASNLQE